MVVSGSPKVALLGLFAINAGELVCSDLYLAELIETRFGGGGPHGSSTVGP
jgi:hypothetical protein